MSLEGAWDYAAWLFFLLFAGSLSWFLSRRSRVCYRKYAKLPDFCPADWVWALTWFFMYILLALAAYLVWKNGGWEHNALALGTFMVMIVVIHCWYIWVYWANCLLGAYIWSIVIAAFVIATTVLFFIECLWSGFIMLAFLFFSFFWIILSHGYYALNGSMWHVDHRKTCVCSCACEKCSTATPILSHRHHGCGPTSIGSIAPTSSSDPVTSAALTGLYNTPGFLKLEDNHV